jgi:16S rRNA (cytosine1402-N4)-methyltransferase
MEQQHIPVLVDEVMCLLGCGPHQVYVDATLGGGGHSLEILKRTSPDGRVIGIEWDEEAIAEAKEALSPFEDRVKIFRENFVRLPALLKEMKIESVDGILFDLGLSSMQLGGPKRGFSFRGEGPLDMRMDRRLETTAADLVNRLSVKDLEETVREYGEERWAKRIAEAIAEERSQGPIETTEGLRKVIYRTIPRRFQSRRLDPATRTFQALRIRVNRELENLKEALAEGWPLLKKGGRICVISFHSLEDRIVKETFRRLERGEAEDPNPKGVVKVITRKPIIPSEEEQRENPRSRSAKLRCAERV